MKRMVVLIAAFAAASSFAAPLYWIGGDATNPTLASEANNWAPAHLPSETDDIVIGVDAANRDLTWDVDTTVASWSQSDYTGTVTFMTGTKDAVANKVVQVCHGTLSEDGVNLEVHVTGDVALSSGTWTHQANPTMAATDVVNTNGFGVYRLWLRADGNITIGASAVIDVTGKGYQAGKGPSPTHSTGGWHSACHGSFGETPYGMRTDVASIYGSVKEPVTLGSGGTTSWTSHGGGAVKLTAAGALTLDGFIHADSSASANYTGAAGSVWLIGATVGGTGTVTANPGKTSNVGNGGGGRIAVWQTAADATFEDFGITLESTNWRGYSYGGTAYLQKASDNGVGELRIPGRTVKPAANDTRPIRIPLTAACGDLRFSKVTLKQYANIGIEAGAVAEIGSIVGEDASKNFVTVYGGTITNAQNMASADKVQLRFFNAGSTVKVAAGEVWTVPSGITTLIDTATTVEGDMVVPSGAKISHSAGKTAESYKIDLTIIGDLAVEAGGMVTTVGSGYAADNGAGKRTVSDKKGGSYGGVAAGSGGAVYGSVREPVNYGSGGGTGAGAGAIRLTVGGTATINGSVDSTAIPPDSNYYPGSGGSVWLTTGKLLGTGTVAANGGDSATAATSGGGGRVAVYLTDPTATFDDFEGVISAFGGGKKGDDVPASGPGTVYLATAEQAANNDGTLVIDNGPTATQKTYAAEISADVTDAEVGAVEIKASGVLGVRKGGVLKVRRSWSNAGTFVGEAGDSETAAGTVEFVDPSVTGTVVGTTAFAGFTCAAAGKRLEFGTGANDLFKIAAGGVLTFAGEEDNLLVLRPAVADTPWNMAVEDGAAAKVSFVDVAWSDARAGATTVVATDSVDSGNNENWSLTNIRVGETIVWKGEVSGLWSQPANWDRSRVPVDTDVVVIPAEAPNAPTLAAETVLNTLVVSNGTSLTLAGYGLTVTNEFRMHGSLVASGTERIEASGPVVDFSRGGVTAANSTLALTGDGDVAFEPNGQAFATVSIAKDDGDIAFASGFSAAKLTVIASSSSFSFPAGSTITAGELRLNGAAGDTTGLFLSSAAAGRSWTLTATGYASVFGTGFTDCTAGGLVLHAEAPTVDGGNNRNIVFNETVSRWTDGSGDHCFTNELNWIGSVPDRTTRVSFDGDATLTIPADVTAEAREFEVMDGVSVKVSGGALAISNNLNVVGATLTLDTPTFVGGNVYLRENAKLAHSACTKTETHRIDLETAGDMEIDATSVIDVVDIVTGGKGAPLPGAPYSIGPSHGGRGGCWYGESIPYIAPCYDSIVEPVEPGTGGSYSKGGGAVKLTVAKTLTLNGDILADGGRINDGVLYYSGSGGSVFLKVGTLAGAGTVSAHGGDNSNAAGAGGRVSVIQFVAEDFSSFTGTMTARSGYMGVEPTGGSGTVYLQSAGQELGEGTVMIDSDVNSPKGGGHQECGVDLPSPDDDPAVIGKMTFIVRHGGCIKLFGDATIGDLILTDAARSNGGYHTQLYLNDCTLHINSREHKNGKGWNGLYNTGSQKLGQILWPQIGLMLLVR